MSVIDFEKLKRAHILANKWSKANGLIMELKTWYGVTKDEYQLRYKHKVYDFQNYDDLILHLEKLVDECKPEPKYEVGQTVWRLSDSDLSYIDMIIESVETDTRDNCCYRDCFEQRFREYELYPSREALIQSQVDYWQSQLEETEKYYQGFGYKSCTQNQENLTCDDTHVKEIEKCVHESDGRTGNYVCPIGMPNYCKWCGEFYR